MLKINKTREAFFFCWGDCYSLPWNFFHGMLSNLEFMKSVLSSVTGCLCSPAISKRVKFLIFCLQSIDPL